MNTKLDSLRNYARHNGVPLREIRDAAVRARLALALAGPDRPGVYICQDSLLDGEPSPYVTNYRYAYTIRLLPGDDPGDKTGWPHWEIVTVLETRPILLDSDGEDLYL